MTTEMRIHLLSMMKHCAHTAILHINGHWAYDPQKSIIAGLYAKNAASYAFMLHPELRAGS